MLVAYVLYPVEVLGPGKRIGIWLNGCHRRCEGCATPQLQDFNMEKEISVQQLCEMVDRVMTQYQVDGITISGGEPLEQADELLKFLGIISTKVEDILLYTGYTLEQLAQIKPCETASIWQYISVLIDGEYLEERNDNHSLKGSDNQNIYYKNSDVQQRYEDYIRQSSKRKRLQTFQVSDGIFTVGIPGTGFRESLEKHLRT